MPLSRRFTRRWGVFALALAWHVLLMTRFLLLLVEQDDARTRTTFWWFFALVGVLAMFSFVKGSSSVWLYVPSPLVSSPSSATWV